MSNPFLRRPCAPTVLWQVKRVAGAAPVAAPTVTAAPAPAKPKRDDDDDAPSVQVAPRAAATQHFVDDVVLSVADGVASIIGVDASQESAVHSVPVASSQTSSDGGKKRLSFKDYALMRSSQ